MKNIFNDSDDEFSDDASVSNRRLSKPIVLNFEENDDTTEKRAKRKSMLIENGSINKLLNNPFNNNQKSDLPYGSRDEKIGNHYGDCIKLAMENKITSKNAFSLHLIDYLGDYVKELRHFQSAGTSLDAGNKIYSMRVDSIHLNTYKVLTGLGNPNEEVAVPDNPVSDDENEKAKTKKVKRKQNIPKNTICHNLKKIRIGAAQIRSEVDPLFQSQAENFDEGGTCDLRCNNLKLLDRTYELLLDSEKIVYTNTREEAPVANNAESDAFDLNEFSAMLQKVRDGQLPFSDHFEDFIFTGWISGSETMNSTTAESFRNMLSAAASHLEEEDHHRMDTGGHIDDHNGALTNNNDYYDDGGCDYGFDGPDEADHDELMREDIIAADEEDNLVIIGTSKADSCVGNVLMASVRDMVNSFVENYGEMNDNMLGMWAGPLYWRQKAKALPKVPVIGENDENNNIKKKRQPTVKPPKEVKSIFPESTETCSNKDGIGRVVWQDNWKFTKTETLSTQLTDVCLNKNIEKDYLLPARTHFSVKSLNQLMNREVTLVNKVLKQHTDKLLTTEIKDESKITNGEYTNANDMVEFGPKPASLIADDDGNVMVYDQNAEDGFGGFDGGDDFSDGGDAYGGNSFHDIDFQEFQPSQQTQEEQAVTAGVRRIEQVDIDYAKSAKRINVKKLKGEIWNSLKMSINAVDVEVIKEKRYPDLPRRAGTSMFSKLLVDVDGKLSNEASRDLSVSILMTCLLHLANETGLDLTNTPDFSDLAIGQGYSDRDLDMIAKFGTRNCLSVIGDSRKRKSLDGSHVRRQRPPKAANVDIIFDDSNDDDDANDDSESL